MNLTAGGMTLPSTIETHLTWQYESTVDKVAALYQRAKTAQWDAATDIDWTQEVPFGAELPEDSAFGVAAFESSPLAARGRAGWDEFRWEFQSWMVSQFLHGEQGALLATSRLVETIPQIESKLFAASQVVDEARHVEAFARYLSEHVPDPYAVSKPLAALMHDLFTDSRWDITALGMQIVIEALAMAAFRTAGATFNDPLIKQIVTMVARDEARHVSFGVLALAEFYPELSSAEIADREEFVLDAAHLMRRRFLLEDVWERMGVPTDQGRDFAAASPMMISYRRTIFAKVVAALQHIGLLTDNVVAGLGELDLLGRIPGRRNPATVATRRRTDVSVL